MLNVRLLAVSGDDLVNTEIRLFLHSFYEVGKQVFFISLERVTKIPDCLLGNHLQGLS